MGWIRGRWRWGAALALLFLGVDLLAYVFVNSHDVEIASAVTFMALAGLLVARRI